MAIAEKDVYNLVLIVVKGKPSILIQKTPLFFETTFKFRFRWKMHPARTSVHSDT